MLRAISNYFRTAWRTINVNRTALKAHGAQPLPMMGDSGQGRCGFSLNRVDPAAIELFRGDPMVVIFCCDGRDLRVVTVRKNRGAVRCRLEIEARAKATAGGGRSFNVANGYVETTASELGTANSF